MGNQQCQKGECHCSTFDCGGCEKTLCYNQCSITYCDGCQECGRLFCKSCDYIHYVDNCTNCGDGHCDKCTPSIPLKTCGVCGETQHTMCRMRKGPTFVSCDSCLEELVCLACVSSSDCEMGQLGEDHNLCVNCTPELTLCDRCNIIYCGTVHNSCLCGDRVEDGVLRVSYDDYQQFDNQYGHLYTDIPYAKYRLRMEYRFTNSMIPVRHKNKFKILLALD